MPDFEAVESLIRARFAEMIEDETTGLGLQTFGPNHAGRPSGREAFVAVDVNWLPIAGPIGESRIEGQLAVGIHSPSNTGTTAHNGIVSAVVNAFDGVDIPGPPPISFLEIIPQKIGDTGRGYYQTNVFASFYAD